VRERCTSEPARSMLAGNSARPRRSCVGRLHPLEERRAGSGCTRSGSRPKAGGRQAGGRGRRAAPLLVGGRTGFGPSWSPRRPCSWRSPGPATPRGLQCLLNSLGGARSRARAIGSGSTGPTISTAVSVCDIVDAMT
jgi:hypothetical protein